jgi:hypothetical protein
LVEETPDELRLFGGWRGKRVAETFDIEVRVESVKATFVTTPFGHDFDMPATVGDAALNVNGRTNAKGLPELVELPVWIVFRDEPEGRIAIGETQQTRIRAAVYVRPSAPRDSVTLCVSRPYKLCFLHSPKQVPLLFVRSGS